MYYFHSLFLDIDASAAFHQVFSLPGAFQFSLMRQGWYICRSVHKNYHRINVVTDFNTASLLWLRRCSFALRPISANENPRMNCFDMVQTPKPSVTLTTPLKPTLPLPTTRPTVPKPEGKIESDYIICKILNTRKSVSFNR